MRFLAPLITVTVASLLAACERPARDQENVTVPGEGPTYLADSTDAAYGVRDTIRPPRAVDSTPQASAMPRRGDP